MRVLRFARQGALAAIASLLLGAGLAKANPAIVVDVDSGRVLYQSEATRPWYPASTTKLMTVYVALSAVREGRITLDTPLMVSPRAAAQEPSKMGFRPGTLVTLDNALKMLMVKSPNDVAVTIAEGIGGSVEDFAEMMNTYGARLGLHESHFETPNGLPNANHYSSARDMAIIARALIREFPEERGLFNIGLLAFGSQLIPNHNGMLGRYPGVDGMKTGYTCSAGYNVVLSAQRDGRDLVAVVFGAPSTLTRTQRAASLLDRGFADPSADLGQVSALPASDETAPPDLRPVICGRGRAGAIAAAQAEDAAEAAGSVQASNGAIEAVGTSPVTAGPSVESRPRVAFTPVRVFVGPVDGWTGPIAHAKNMAIPAPTNVADATAASQAAALLANRESGPTESPAPAPLALAGAIAPPPAAAAANAFVRKTKSLSLAVASRHRARPAKATAKLPPTKTVSILKDDDEKPAKAAPKRAAKKGAGKKDAAKKPAARHPAGKTAAK